MFNRATAVVFGLLAFGAIASADSINFQLANSTANFSSSPVDRVQESGANPSFTLVLNAAAVSENFYAALYTALCTTNCSGTLTTTLSANPLNLDIIATGATGHGVFAQNFEDVIAGTGANETHTFNAEAGSPIVIALTNGNFVTITPQASAPDQLSQNSANVSQEITALFQYTSTNNAAVPEPTSVILLLTAIALVGWSVRRRFAHSL